MSNALDRCREEWNDRCERRGKEYAMVRHDDLAKLIALADAVLNYWSADMERHRQLVDAVHAITQEAP